MLDRVLRGMRLREAMDSMPAEVLDAMEAALTAYVQSRRDPETVRAVLVSRIPAIIHGLDGYVRENLRTWIRWDTDDIRKGKAPNATPLEQEGAKTAEEGLRDAQTVKWWLWGRK
jgi:hypothetical protein